MPVVARAQSGSVREQLGAQPLARLVEADGDGVGRAAEHAAYLGVVELLPEGETQDLLVERAQLSHRGPDQFVELDQVVGVCALCGVRGVVVCGGSPDAERGQGQSTEPAAQEEAARRAPAVVAQDSVGEGVEPEELVLFGGQRVATAPRRREDLGNDVGDVVACVRREAPQDVGVDGRVPALVKRFESLARRRRRSVRVYRRILTLPHGPHAIYMSGSTRILSVSLDFHRMSTARPSWWGPSGAAALAVGCNCG